MKIYTSVGKLEKKGEALRVSVNGIERNLTGLEKNVWESALFSFMDITGITKKTKFNAKRYAGIEATDVQVRLILDRLLEKGVIAQGTGETDTAAIEDLFWRCHFISTEIKMYGRIKAFLYSMLTGQGITISMQAFEGASGSKRHVLEWVKKEGNMESYRKSFAVYQQEEQEIQQSRLVDFKNKILFLYHTRNLLIDHVVA